MMTPTSCTGGRGQDDERTDQDRLGPDSRTLRSRGAHLSRPPRLAGRASLQPGRPDPPRAQSSLRRQALSHRGHRRHGEVHRAPPTGRGPDRARLRGRRRPVAALPRQGRRPQRPRPRTAMGGRVPRRPAPLSSGGGAGAPLVGGRDRPPDQGAWALRRRQGGPTFDVAQLAKSVTVLVGGVLDGGAASTATALAAVAGTGKWSLPIGRWQRATDQDERVKDMLAAVNALIAEVQSSGKRVSLFIDGLDRVREVETVRNLFVESSLRRLERTGPGAASDRGRSGGGPRLRAGGARATQRLTAAHARCHRGSERHADPARDADRS